MRVIDQRKEKKKERQVVQRTEVFTDIDADIEGVFGAPFCPIEYRPSSIPGAGNGIFATVDLIPGDIVTWYSGKFSSDEPVNKTYAVAVRGGYIDGLSSIANLEVKAKVSAKVNEHFHKTRQAMALDGGASCVACDI